MATQGEIEAAAGAIANSRATQAGGPVVETPMEFLDQAGHRIYRGIAKNIREDARVALEAAERVRADPRGEKPEMTLDRAIAVLALVHTSEDETVGFCIRQGGPDAWSPVSPGEYVEAWRALRRSVGKRHT